MNEKLPYWASVVLSVAALVLLVVNITFANANRTKQAELAARQSTIASGQTFAQVNQGLVQAMAEASIKNNDAQLRDLLSAQGITLKSEQAPKPTEKK